MCILHRFSTSHTVKLILQFVLAGECTNGILPVSGSTSYNCPLPYGNGPACTSDLQSYGSCRGPRDFWDGCALPRFYYQQEAGYGHQCEDSRYPTVDSETWGTYAGANSRFAKCYNPVLDVQVAVSPLLELSTSMPYAFIDASAQTISNVKCLQAPTCSRRSRHCLTSRHRRGLTVTRWNAGQLMMALVRMSGSSFR